MCRTAPGVSPGVGLSGTRHNRHVSIDYDRARVERAVCDSCWSSRICPVGRIKNWSARFSLDRKKEAICDHPLRSIETWRWRKLTVDPEIPSEDISLHLADDAVGSIVIVKGGVYIIRIRPCRVPRKG